MESNKSVLKVTTLLGGVQGLNVLLTVVRTKLVAWFLGPEGIGLNSIYNQVRELLHTTSNLGLDVSGIRGISASYEQYLQSESETEKTAAQANIDSQVSILRSWIMLLAALGALMCMVIATPLSLFTFHSYSHASDFIILAPAVAFSTISCGELVVLRAIRRLKAVALVSTLNVVAGIVVTIPIYWAWHIDGVLMALLAFCLVQMIIVMSFSYRYSRPTFSFRSSHLKKGLPMFSLGLSFVVSGIMASGMDLLIQAHINGIGSEYSVGLYKAGYTITATYAGLVFTAFDSDYLPRLSGVVNDLRLRCQTVCQQLEIVLLLIGPILVIMAFALPIIIPMLYTNEFVEVIPMVQIAVISILFRAIYLPAAYLPLAAGHSRIYLFIQFVGALDLLLVIVGYDIWGLWGAGLGLVGGNFIDMVLVHFFARYKYGIRLTVRFFRMMLFYAAIVMVTYGITTTVTGLCYWLIGVVLVAVSSLFSLYQYKRL